MAEFDFDKLLQGVDLDEDKICCDTVHPVIDKALDAIPGDAIENEYANQLTELEAQFRDCIAVETTNIIVDILVNELNGSAEENRKKIQDGDFWFNTAFVIASATLIAWKKVQEEFGE